jgi:hypothetical protein
MSAYEDWDEPVNLDESLENSDWPKTQSWDLPTTLDACMAKGVDLNKIAELPAGLAMPESLRAELASYNRALGRREISRAETGNG